MSVIDYFISTPDIFQIVDQFIVSNFTVYSDHAPLHVKLMIKSDQVLYEVDTASCEAASEEFSCYIWDQERCNDAKEALHENLDKLYDCVEHTGHSVSSMNETVEHFSKILTDIMCPYFEVRRKKTMRSGSLRRSAHSRGTVIDKPWFTPELKNKFTTYRIALSTFNRTKNKKNHQLLLVAKKKL